MSKLTEAQKQMAMKAFLNILASVASGGTGMKTEPTPTPEPKEEGTRDEAGIPDEELFTSETIVPITMNDFEEKRIHFEITVKDKKTGERTPTSKVILDFEGEDMHIISESPFSEEDGGVPTSAQRVGAVVGIMLDESMENLTNEMFNRVKAVEARR